jgi:hypothetical protein
MKRTLLILTIFLLCFSSVQSQHYITPTIGYSLAFFNSDGLDEFTETYNGFHRDFQFGLLNEFKGLDKPVGIRLELAYQYFGKLAGFANFGFQNFVTTDFAEFDNREERKLELKQRSFFIEGGIGPRLQQFFFTGIVAVYFSKRLSLESTYNLVEDPDQPLPLSGKYESDNTMSVDLGIAIGVVRDPLTLTLKLTYPVFTGGKNEVLSADNLAKMAAGTSVFPNNFDDFYFGDPYEGIMSNIDGLKIMFTIGVPFRLKGSDDDW